jgi:hypothetical protein
MPIRAVSVLYLPLTITLGTNGEILPYSSYGKNGRFRSPCFLVINSKRIIDHCDILSSTNIADRVGSKKGRSAE